MQPGGGFFHELKRICQKVKFFIVELCARLFGMRAASPGLAVEPSSSDLPPAEATDDLAATESPGQPVFLPTATKVRKPREVKRGPSPHSLKIVIPGGMESGYKAKRKAEGMIGVINGILRRIEDRSRSQGDLSALRIRSFYSGEYLKNIEQLRAEVDRLNLELTSDRQNKSPKRVLNLISDIHRALLAAAPPPSASETPKEEIAPVPITVLPSGVVKEKESPVEAKKAEPEPPPSFTSIMEERAEKIAADLAVFFPGLAIPVKSALLKLLAHRVRKVEALAEKLAAQIKHLTARSIHERELFGTVHEAIRLAQITESREAGDRLTVVGLDLGEVTFYLPELIRNGNGKYHLNGGKKKATQSLDADGYCSRSKTFIEIKYCANSRWFMDGEISAGEKEVVFNMVSQFRKYRKALEGHSARTIEFHFTASSIHPKVIKALEDAFQEQIGKVRIYLYPNNLSAHGGRQPKPELIYDGAEKQRPKPVARDPSEAREFLASE
jgi:hypothetical protein